jgi:hypothetical protein
MSRWAKRGVVAASIIAILAALGYGYYRYQFPYGWSHCCDKHLLMALNQYAEEHDGWFPRGEATPEASLSLLCRQTPELAYILRGKTVSEEVRLASLQGRELLTPETCGWHYVEGLRRDDDPRLALFWDKAGLGHNGQRLSSGRHVWLVGGYMEHIPHDRWEEFLTEQERLWTALKRPR